MKSVSIKFPLAMLATFYAEAQSRGLDLSTYLRAKLASTIHETADFHTPKDHAK